MADFAWRCATLDAPWRPRDGAGLLSFEGSMYLLGGWHPCEDGDQPFLGTNWTVDSEVWRTQDGVAWECITTEAAWPGRHTAGYCVHDGKMWVLGGDIYCNTDDVWCSSDGVEWTCMCEAAPWGPGRVTHHTVVFEGAIYVIGGQTTPQFRANTPNVGKYKTAPPVDEAFFSDVWRSVDGASWECLTKDAPWGPRALIGGSAVKDGYIWLLGGGLYDTPGRPARDFRNDVWRSRDGVGWELVLAEAPWAARQYHDCAVFDNKLWVCEGYGLERGSSMTVSYGAGRQNKWHLITDSGGGENKEEHWPSLDELQAQGESLANRSDVWYSEDGVEWHELSGTPWLPRHAASLCAHRGELWLMAGNAVDPKDGSWTVSDAWALARRPTAAATGRHKL